MITTTYVTYTIIIDIITASSLHSLL